MLGHFARVKGLFFLVDAQNKTYNISNFSEFRISNELLELELYLKLILQCAL